MIRFIDLRGQGTAHRFAFWDTVENRFFEFSGEQAWDTADDFSVAYASSFVRVPFGGIDRFLGLAPAWTSTPPAADEEL